MIKIFLNSIVLSTLLLANNNQMFQNMKNMVNMMYQQQYLMFKQLRECYSNADTRNEAIKCSMTIAQIDEKTEVYADNKQWNAQTKAEALQSLDKALKDMQKTKQCMDKSNTMEEFDKCNGE